MNLSIPDAAAELAVSETRLRRTLLENAVSTTVEFRQTRTGVRKTTVLSPEALAQLRAFFAAPVPSPLAVSPPVDVSAVRDEPSAYEYRARAEEPASMEEDASEPEAYAPQTASPAQSVPLSQFNALLFQHNVLREELARVSEYLDGCDRLLGEMVRTIATLEERTRQLDPAPSLPVRSGNPLAGALHSVSAGLRNTLFARGHAKAMLKPAEVYYSNVLAGR